MRALLPLSLVLLLAGCAGEPDPAGLVSRPGSDRPVAPAASPVPPDTVARALYWLGADDPRGPRLYREFVRLPAGADPVRDSVQAVLSREPADPDYRSLWAPGTSVLSVQREGTTAVVDLSAQARTNGGGSAFAAASLQQLVHVATAADPSVQALRLTVDGEPLDDLWGAVDASRPVRRAPAAEVLGPVWLDVEEGAVLGPEFGGTATVFEATVSWQLRQGERVVQEGFSTATEGAPGRGAWTGQVDVPPGDYELWAYESSAKDGSVTWLDTKRVTVR